MLTLEVVEAPSDLNARAGEEGGAVLDPRPLFAPLPLVEVVDVLAPLPLPPRPLVGFGLGVSESSSSERTRLSSANESFFKLRLYTVISGT